jgi:hypothetical protein
MAATAAIRISLLIVSATVSGYYGARALSARLVRRTEYVRVHPIVLPELELVDNRLRD